MSGSESDRPVPPRKTGLFGGAGRVLALAAVVFAVVAWMQLRNALDRDRHRGPGDGENVASYGFDLSPLLVAREALTATHLPRDGLVALDHPPLLDVAGVDSLNRAERGKYLVYDDLVIGLELAGVARAYPVRVLDWHEVANDTLGGTPVAVTWQAVCGSAVVFDRRLAGRTLSFGHSGLLWNSNLLIYDREPEMAGAAGSLAAVPREDDRPVDPSLWLQLQGRAIAGPAAERGDSLRILPHVLTRWGRWRDAHPRTTVPLPSPDMRQRYKRDPYGAYQGSDLLRIPVSPLPPPPPEGRWRFKQCVVSLWRGTGWSPPALAQPARATSGSLLHPTIHAYWFAWYALRQAARSAPDTTADARAAGARAASSAVP